MPFRICASSLPFSARKRAANGKRHDQASSAVVSIFIADNVILAEIVAELHFDDLDGICPEVLEPMDRPSRDIDRFGGYEIDDAVGDCDGGCAGDHSPVLDAALVALKRQAAAGTDDDALHLEALAFIEDMECAPRTVLAVDHVYLH